MNSYLRKNTKVLVTGGAGFIGSHLVDKLLEVGLKVVCIDNFTLGNKKNLHKALRNPNFKLCIFNLLEIQELKKLFNKESFDIVFHLAANSNIQLGSVELQTDYKNTFLTTFNVLNCMKEYNVKQLIFSSSSAIYGEAGEHISEDYGPLFPISFYGSAKLASEAYISAFCENFSINAWIIRFPNVVGDRLTHGVIYDFINKLSKDPSGLQVLGDGNQRKPYLYIDDLLDAIFFIYQNTNKKINYFNLAAKSTTSVQKIAEIIIEKMDLKNVDIKFTGSDRGWIGDVPRFSYDTTKINNLGWEPSMTSDEAIILAVQKELTHRGLLE